MLTPGLFGLGAHFSIEGNQRFGFGRHANLQCQGHAGVAVFPGNSVNFLHIKGGRIDGKLVTRGNHALVNARCDDHAL